MRPILLATALVCIGFAVPATVGAADKAPNPEKIFTRKDSNKDGFLSLDEFKAGLKEPSLQRADKRFRKSDSNGDGKLSIDEFKAALPKPKS